ncbi:hypothetical protein ABID37_002720 [Aquamicrobium terrae]|uniref:Uncharacterized protein n=1 Tax=Aquamicrobium terrae TaxID=1324945 RepID=A0ABV2N3S3_9HYPH
MELMVWANAKSSIKPTSPETRAHWVALDRTVARLFFWSSLMEAVQEPMISLQSHLET